MKFKDIIWILFISMVPLIELRGAVPVGALVLKLPFYMNFLSAVIGNLIPIPFILIFIPKILDFLERFKLFRPIVRWLHEKANKNRTKIDKNTENTSNSADAKADAAAMQAEEISTANLDTVSTVSAKNEKTHMPIGVFIGLMLFVLLPLPGTGAWTGALVASLFNFPKLKSFLAIALGVLGCGVIMCLASYGVLGFLSFLA